MDGMEGMDLSKMMGGMGGDDLGPDAMSDEDDIVYDDLEVGEEADVSKLKDGGCVKKVLVKGTGTDRPETGSEVTVHYTGTLLDGTKFDSSVDRGDPFKFKLGVGQVIKGWDEGVASMLKGEKAILTCKPDYAYGARGSPPTIPPDATLQFEVELFSWTSDKDYFDDGGCVRVKTLKRSSAYGSPEDIDEVTVSYAVSAPDDDVAGAGDEIVKPTDATFAVKDAPFVGLGAILKKMKEGESVLARMRDVPGGTQYCSGLPGAPAAPSAADVTVTLKSYKKVDSICDGAGWKKTTADGEGWDVPNDGAKCVASWTAKTTDGTHRLLEERKALAFETGSEEIARGVEECVMMMKKGESAECFVPAAHNDLGEDALYSIDLTAFEKEKETYAMSNRERVDAGERAKAAGNDAYKAGKLSLASHKYDKALRFVEYDQSFSDEEKAETKKMKLSLYLNGAAVALKTREYAKATASATKALGIDAANEKALYRRAQAAAESEEYDDAKRDVGKLLEKDEGHKEAKALMLRIKRLEAAQAKKDAKVFGGMFGKLGGLYEEEETPAAKEEEAPKIEPVDIGNGFTMEEVTDEEAAEKGLEGLQDA